ncbi:MAG: SCO family protein [Anaerolineaceae bacterium]|nr:SCO family protein [Anaerolineaceae bacterium]
MADREGGRRPLRPAFVVALVLSLSITLGSLLFIVWRLANPSFSEGPVAQVDSGSWFDGATHVDPPRPLSDFTLLGTDGRPLGLADLKGRATLLVFGYTRCPDYCPLTLKDFTRVKAALGDSAKDVNLVMVSVDGEVDQPLRLRDWLATFDPTILGMTGAREEVRRVGEEFGLYLATSSQPGLLDHSTSSFLIDRDGRLRTTFTVGTSPAVIVDYVQQVLN